MIQRNLVKSGGWLEKSDVTLWEQVDAVVTAVRYHLVIWRQSVAGQGGILVSGLTHQLMQHTQLPQPFSRPIV